MFLDLECDGLPGHLQEVDGLAQRLPFQTDPVDGEDSVPYMDGSSPAGLGEQRRQRYQSIPDSTGVQAGKTCQAASAPTEMETKGLLVTQQNETAIVCRLVYLRKKQVSKRGRDSLD